MTSFATETVVRPSASADYQLRWTSTDRYLTSAVSAVVRVRVAPRVVAAFDNDVVAARSTSSGSRTAAGRTPSPARCRRPAARRFTFAKRPGVYHYRAYLPGHTDHGAGAGTSLRFEVLG